MEPTLLPLATGRSFAAGLVEHGGLEARQLDQRHFPDGESYLRLAAGEAPEDAAVVASLHPPNDTLLDALLAAATARDLGAERVGLVAPYLAYLRQDARFKRGEAVTSRHVAGLISARFDWMLTVDPHLHRWDSLDAIYTVPTWTVSSSAPVAEWMARNVEEPVVIGPDAESAQWIAPTAEAIGAPRAVLDKERQDDRSVSITVDELPADREEGTPVLLDDIISSGGTMVEAITRLRECGFESPICVGIHGLFADDAYADLLDAGADEVVTTDTVEHHSNEISVAARVAEVLRSVEW